MRYAKVIVIAVTGIKGRSHNSGEIVNEDQFPAGKFDELIKGEYLQFHHHDGDPVNERNHGEVRVIRTPRDNKPEGVKQAEKRDGEKKKQTETLQGIDEKRQTVVSTGDVTEEQKKARIEMIAELEKLEATFNPNASNNELYQLLRKLKAKK